MTKSLQNSENLLLCERVSVKHTAYTVALLLKYIQHFFKQNVNKIYKMKKISIILHSKQIKISEVIFLFEEKFVPQVVPQTQCNN